MIDGFEKFEVSEEIKLQRSTLLTVIDKLADEKGVEADLPRDKIKEIVRRYTWKDSFNRLKIIGQKISKGEVVSPEELIEIEFLFAEETNNRRRQIFTDKEIVVEGKNDLLQALRSQNIFILSHGAIESYYPNGIVGDDKPTKALNAINFLKEQAVCKVHLPTITIGEEVKCELEIIYEKIFEA